jgi:hypothetical protein
MRLTFELRSVEGQGAFNARRWREVLADPILAKPFKAFTRLVRGDVAASN